MEAVYCWRLERYFNICMFFASGYDKKCFFILMRRIMNFRISITANHFLKQKEVKLKSDVIGKFFTRYILLKSHQYYHHILFYK